MAVGENMKGTPGLAGRTFGALGRRNINIIAIAQGSSELTIAIVVRRDGLEAAVRALRRIHLRRRQEDVQQELKKPGLSGNRELLKELLTELERISRALRDPNLAEDGLKMAGTQKTA